MMRSVVHRDTGSSSDEESTGDLFSPVQGRMQSLHNFDTPDTPDDGAARLPRLADNSWIGARVSPIPSVEEEDDDDLILDRITAPYQRTLREFGANERSALLGKSIHPMWDDNFFEDAKRVAQSVSHRPTIWGKVVVGASTIHFFCIGLHDVFMYYLQIRRGIPSQYSLAWSIPWLGPSTRILLRFGAYCPGKIIWQRQWYRVMTSWTLTSSVAELIGVAAAWWQLERISHSMTPTVNWRIWWPSMFLSSICVGQLWMAAFGSYYSISGCSGWGTCSALCATGVLRPDKRMTLFLTAIILVILNLFQSGSNVFGAVGASFFGWSVAGTGLTPFSTPVVKEHIMITPRWIPLNWLSLVTAVLLWTLPMLFIKFGLDIEEAPIFDGTSYTSSTS